VVKRALVEGAAQVMAVAAADKLGTAGPFAVAPIGPVSPLVTDRSAPEHLLRPFKSAGIEVITA
jgi:DeoR/GlpR family transcriptional regulator of sugar metabolism